MKSCDIGRMLHKGVEKRIVGLTCRGVLEQVQGAFRYKDVCAVGIFSKLLGAGRMLWKAENSCLDKRW